MSEMGFTAPEGLNQLYFFAVVTHKFEVLNPKIALIHGDSGSPNIIYSGFVIFGDVEIGGGCSPPYMTITCFLYTKY